LRTALLPTWEGSLDPLPELHPRESHTLLTSLPIQDVRRIVVDVLRPTGFSAARVELLLASAIR